MFLVNALWDLYVLNRPAAHVDADRFSAVLVSGLLVTLLGLQVGALWGSVSTALDYMDCDEVEQLPTAAGNILLKCGTFQTPATALCVLSSLVFCAQGSCTAMLYAWQDEFLGRTAAATSPASTHAAAYESMAAREETEPFPTDPLPGVFANLSASPRV